MKRSVRWHLLINSLAISLTTLIVVGLVTLYLVNNHFTRQEEEFLLERGENIVEPLETALRWGGHADLDQVASLSLLANQVRVKVIDQGGHVLVDSGSFEDLIPPKPHLEMPDFGSAFQFFIDDRGYLRGYGSLFTDEAKFGIPFDPLDNVSLGTDISRSISFARTEPIVDLSAASIRIPLRVNKEVVAFAELSEGPAFGTVIRNSVQKALLVGAAVALAVAALAALLTARQLTKPVQSLSEAAGQMAAGNLDARAPSNRLKEYDLLANQFNLMADRLGELIASLEADKSSLRRFIADASHELRTPLTALKTFNDLLWESVSIEDKLETTFVKESGVQIAQLDRLTSDLLNLSRLESRLSGTDFVTADLRLSVERAVNALTSSFREKRQQISVETPPEPLMLSHDRSALERAVSNLLVNASKFTPEEGLIQVRVTHAEDEVYVKVIDSGPGIPSAEIDFIFERFYRGRDQKVDGSGLGLSIAQETAIIHGGKIEVRSREGEGSEFTMILPRQ